MHIRTLYFRNLLTDLRRFWILILAVILICGAAGAYYGYRSANKKLELTPEQQEKIDHFNERVKSYDDAIADTEKCIAENNEAVENLQNYIDNSIYMKLDPDSLKVSSVQYVVTVEEGVSLGNVQNSIISFINDGGLVSSLQAKSNEGEDSNNSAEASYGEYTDLNPAYWRDVVTISCPANMVVITVYHYNADTGMRILDVIREKLAAECEVIRTKQGGFTLEGEEIAALVKGDVGFANAQNNNHNNLRSYLSLRSDYETKFVSQNNSKESYIENNKPEELELPSPKKNAVKFGVFGLIIGAVLVIGVLALKYIFSDRIRSEEELRDAGLAVLAKSSGRKGLLRKGRKAPETLAESPAELHPSPERLVMDAAELVKATGSKGVYLQDLTGQKTAKAAADTLAEAFDAADITSAYGTSEGDLAEDLKSMMKLGSAVLLIEAGKTTFRQLEKQINLCQRFGIRLLGCVLYE